jgi:hypothetical protein
MGSKLKQNKVCNRSVGANSCSELQTTESDSATLRHLLNLMAIFQNGPHEFLHIRHISNHSDADLLLDYPVSWVLSQQEEAASV